MKVCDSFTAFMIEAKWVVLVLKLTHLIKEIRMLIEWEQNQKGTFLMKHVFINRIEQNRIYFIDNNKINTNL